MLSVWLWTADDDGVDKFVLHKMPHTMVNKVTKLSAEDYVPGELMKVIDGFVYVSVVLSRDTIFRVVRILLPGNRRGELAF